MLSIAKQDFDDEVKRQDRAIKQNGSIFELLQGKEERPYLMDVDTNHEKKNRAIFSFQGTSKSLENIDQFDIDRMNDEEYTRYCSLIA